MTKPPARAQLTNLLVRDLPLAVRGQYVVRDQSLPGFFIVVGRAAKTFTIQVDTRRLGVRKTIRESIGRSDTWDAQEARKEAMARIGALQTGAREAVARRGRTTLRDAWNSYRALLGQRVAAGSRRQRTLDGYADSVERLLAGWFGDRRAQDSCDADH